MNGTSSQWKRKLENFWFYHRVHVLLILAVSIMSAYLFMQSRSVIPADYTVAFVSGYGLDGDEAEAIAEQLGQYGEDVNGDGKVHVDVHQIQLDLRRLAENGGTEGEKERGQLMALEADMASCQSVLYLTDDPEALWLYTGVLVYKDGTEPSRNAKDFENMVIPWKMPFDSESFDSRIYLGCRGCWQENQKDAWAASWKLWESILKNTEDT